MEFKNQESGEIFMFLSIHLYKLKIVTQSKLTNTLNIHFQNGGFIKKKIKLCVPRHPYTLIKITFPFICVHRGQYSPSKQFISNQRDSYYKYYLHVTADSWTFGSFLVASSGSEWNAFNSNWSSQSRFRFPDVCTCQRSLKVRDISCKVSRSEQEVCFVGGSG